MREDLNGVATRTFYALGVSRLSVTPGDYVMTICFSSTLAVSIIIFTVLVSCLQ